MNVSITSCFWRPVSSLFRIVGMRSMARPSANRLGASLLVASAGSEAYREIFMQGMFD
jgi:hypothetical protein